MCCHKPEDYNVKILSLQKLKIISKVLMVSVLHGGCYVYISLNLNSRHDVAGQHVVVLSASAVVMLLVKLLDCRNYGRAIGMRI
jgi:hypothetical protein